MGVDFSWITPSLAVGASFSCEDVELLAREHRIGAVVDLRAESCDDALLLASHGIAFRHLPTPDMLGVTEAMLHDGVAFVTAQLAASRRVLVHCQHGIGRSALLVLCVLVHGGQPPLAALEMAKSQRVRVSPSQAQFDAWLAWLRSHRAKVGASWEPPTFDEFAAIAYRHLRA